jgi:hypothetical protein
MPPGAPVWGGYSVKQKDHFSTVSFALNLNLHYADCGRALLLVEAGVSLP